MARQVESRHNTNMRILSKVCFAASILLLGFVAMSQTPAGIKHEPIYTREGQLRLPSDYREWVYLSSGFDMSYNPDMQMDHHMFDNVFVNPEAWHEFQSSGKWPDKTLLVLEVRHAEAKGSINQKGNFQAEIMHVEVHVKDESRFTGKWAFFGFSPSDTTANMIPVKQECYTCHGEHGAVDTTFVQFYPTLLQVARAKGTLSTAYLQESSSVAGTPK